MNRLQRWWHRKRGHWVTPAIRMSDSRVGQFILTREIWRCTCGKEWPL